MASQKPNKNYGFQIPVKTNEGTLPKRKFRTQSHLSAFKDEPEPVKVNTTNEKSKSIDEKQLRLQRQALQEDASVFEYDSIYDSIHSRAKGNTPATKSKKPLYIQSLVEKAKIREMEHERIREKRLLKERKSEDAIFGDREKLISASYKRKLIERRQWDEEDARLQVVEEMQDVTKRGEEAMAGFYRNLLTRNIAMGGDAAATNSAYTVIEPSNRKRSRTSPEKKEIKSYQNIEAANVTPTSDIKDDSTLISKSERIQAAKARYLARKQTKQE